MSRRVLITLEQRVQVANGTTGITETYQSVGEYRAHVGGVSGLANVGTAQIEDGTTHRVVIRWVDPTTFTHFRRDNERFRVKGTRDPDYRRRWLEIMGEQLAMEAEA